EYAAFAVASNPAHAIVPVGAGTLGAHAAACSGVRFLNVDAQQHMQPVARVGRGHGEVIELIPHLHVLAPEHRGQGTVRIVDFNHLILDVVFSGPAAEHVSELGPVHGGVGYSMIAAETAAFAYITKQASANLGVIKNQSDHAVEKHGVVLFNLRILEIVEIVAEHRLEGSGVFRHQLQHQVHVLHGGVRIGTQIHDQKLARLPGLHDRLPGYGGIDLCLHIGGQRIRAV